MRINYNVSAMIANNSLKNNDDLLSASLQKLSSGFKINNAKDNPAGLAMAKRMNAQIKGTSTADDNTMDGISVIETADGALAEVTAMLQRMNELAVQASNGTLNDDDRELIQKEVSELKDEINRVSKSTEFNSQPLLDGFYDLKAYTDNIDYKCLTYSREVPADKYNFSSISWTKDADGNYEVSVAGGNASANKYSPFNATLVDDVITITGAHRIPTSSRIVPQSVLTCRDIDPTTQVVAIFDTSQMTFGHIACNPEVECIGTQHRNVEDWRIGIAYITSGSNAYESAKVGGHHIRVAYASHNVWLM